MDADSKAFPLEDATCCMHLILFTSFPSLNLLVIFFLFFSTFTSTMITSVSSPLLLLFSGCLSASEATWPFLCSPSRHWGVFASRDRPGISWPWRIWVWWSPYSSTNTHHRVCTWCSLKYSFLSTFMGPQVSSSSFICYLYILLYMYNVLCLLTVMFQETQEYDP